MLVTKEMKISDVTKKYPDTLSVFGNFRIDFCCGGAKTIEEASVLKKLDMEKLLEELNEIADKVAKV